MSFVIGIEKMIEVTLGISLQRKIKVYPQKKESLNINPPMSHHADVSVRWNCYLGSFNNYNDDIRIDIDRLITLIRH